MAIADTKVYYITAAGTTPEDYITALQAHFAAAPGLWESKPGVSTITGQGLVIKPKAAGDYKHDVALRRVGTTDIAVATDPGKGITDTGSPSVAITGSASMSPEGRIGTAAFGSQSPDMLVIECSTAVFAFWQDTAKTAYPYGLHCGEGHKPQHDNDAAFGMDGSVNLVGVPASSGSPSWSSTSEQTNGSRIRVFDVAGVASWQQANFTAFPFSSSSAQYAAYPDAGRASPRKPSIRARIASNQFVECGLMQYIAYVPSNSSDIGSLNPGRRLEGTVDIWLTVRNTNSTAGGMVPWEKGVLAQ